MATIDNKELIDKAIASNGNLYPDDPFEPKIIRIVEYTNAWDRVTWGVVFENERSRGDAFVKRYETPTPYVRNPKVIFERK